jgi:tRNA (guanine-N7-)-methyltransferase
MEVRRAIRSYVLRQGRLTPGQKQALEQLWSIYGIDYAAEPLDSVALFGRSAALTLEIGFGDGDSLLQQASRSPERDFIGIEVHRPGIGRLLSRCHAAGLSNLRVSKHDAVEVLRQQIADQSLDCVQLFFPDPWHKKRHHKRRILQPEFAALVLSKLRPGGHFHMATDWLQYAEHMLAVMAASPGFVNVAGAGQYCRNEGLRPLTRFEQRGLRLGHGVYDLRYLKPG